MVVLTDPAQELLRLQRTVTGRIAVEHGLACFPNKEWRDFPLVLLQWWSDELRELWCGMDRNARLRFMDGPYEIQIHVSDGGITVSYLENDCTSVNYGVSQRELLTMIESVANGARDWLIACERHGVKSSDVNRLIKSYDMISKVLTRENADGVDKWPT